MKKNIDFIFLVPARKGSTRVKNKNFKKLNNLSLVEYTFKFIKENFNSKIYFTTDYELNDLTKKKYDIEKINRPKKLCTSAARPIDVILHALGQIKKTSPQVIIFLQPTVPFRKVESLKKAMNFFKIKKKIDSVAGYIYNPFYQPQVMGFIEGSKVKPLSKSSTKYIGYKKDKIKLYTLDGSFYLFRRKLVEKEKLLIGKNHYGVINPLDQHVNIDTPLDWKIAQLLLDKKT